MKSHIYSLKNFLCGTRGKRRRSSWTAFKSVVLYLSVGCFFLTVMLISYASYKLIGESDETVVDLSTNYFQSHDKLANRSFLVDTGKCTIPDVDIWDAGIRPLVGPPSKFKCADTYMKLTYVNKDNVVINEDALKSVGYTLDGITCCYHVIERVGQTKESYNMSADNVFRYSKDCFPMEKITKPKSSFIRVTCNAKGFLKTSLKYSNFHMIAKFEDETNMLLNGNISRKLLWWENCLSTKGKLKFDTACKRFREHGRPPNVLVIGWDSTSRGNFHRFMNKTKDILTNVLKAVEMLGYNKVGENTFPNFVPLMSSLSVKELVKKCFFRSSFPQDDCPYIWKTFSEHNYLTGHLEDSPNVATFNYLKTGFIKPPADIYARPFMLAAYEEKGGGKNFMDCIGYQRPEELILDYIVDFADLAESKRVPYFLTTWLTDLTHENLNNLQLADSVMAKTLEQLYKKGLLENTVLFLMSDHGYRFLEIRTTTTGWFEDKLPTLWIKLPPSVIREHGTWVDALTYNSRILSTPFDLYESFSHLLTAYWQSDKKSKEEFRLEASIRGVSAFTKLPTRSCGEAGIPLEFCSCIPPTACRFNTSLIKLAAERVVQSINTNLPPECAPLKVDTVTACGIIKESGAKISYGRDPVHNSGDDDEIGSSDVVVVTLLTRPGKFLFEALVHYNKTIQQFSEVSKLSRINIMTISSSCLKKKDGWIELLCHCDTLLYKTKYLAEKIVPVFF